MWVRIIHGKICRFIDVCETEFILVLLFTNYCLVFHMTNCKSTFASSCTLSLNEGITLMSEKLTYCPIRICNHSPSVTPMEDWFTSKPQFVLLKALVHVIWEMLSNDVVLDEPLMVDLLPTTDSQPAESPELGQTPREAVFTALFICR